MAEDWAADVKKYVPDADDGIISGIVRYCGIALQKRDSSLVSFGDPKETARVRNNFLKKKLGLAHADDVLDAAIAAVGERMKGTSFRNRVTVYYLLAENFGMLGLFAKAAKPAKSPKAAKGSATGSAGAGAAAAGTAGLGLASLGGGNTSAPPTPSGDEGSSIAGKIAAGAGAAGALAAGAAATIGSAGQKAVGAASDLASDAADAAGSAAASVTGAVSAAGTAALGAAGAVGAMAAGGLDTAASAAGEAGRSIASGVSGAADHLLGGGSGSDGDEGGSGMGWLWWLLLGLLALLLIWWLFLRQPDGAAGGSDASATASADAMAAGSMDSSTGSAAPAPMITAPAEGSVAIPAGAGVTTEMREGKPVVKVYFDSGKAALVPAFAPAADGLKAWLDGNAGSSLAVSGFADKTGNAAANAELSKNRAQAVKAALVAAGIPDASVALVKPAEPTDASAANDGARRVEVVVR